MDVNHDALILFGILIVAWIMISSLIKDTKGIKSAIKRSRQSGNTVTIDKATLIALMTK